MGRRPKMKKETKLALITQRLAMLQDDHLDDVSQLVSPITVENPTPKLRMNNIVLDEVNANNLPATDGTELRICESTSAVRDSDEDSPSEEMIVGPSTHRREHGSYNRLVVISDDEEEDADKNRDMNQFDWRRRTKRKLVLRDNSLDHENFNGCIIPVKKSKRQEGSNNSSKEKMSSAMKRAKDVQAKLPAQYPSFVKVMLPSHASRVFWLGIKKKFCDDHLPKSDCTMVLIDEVGMTFNANYLAQKTALSGGWRAFALNHKICESDVVVFQLIAPTTFKIYIVRKDDLGECDGALGLLNLDTGVAQPISEDHSQSQKILNNEEIRPSDVSPSNSDVDDPLDGICFADSTIDFGAINGFEDFFIIVDGLRIDSKFSDTIRRKYYDLCCSQNSFLHEHLLKGLNMNLVFGIISETINIADALKSFTASTSVNDLQTWERTLKGFEYLGMKVDFLCAKINQLLGTPIESTRYQLCSTERACAGEKMRALENKLVRMKEMMEKLNSEMDAEMIASAQRQEAKIKEIANATW